MLENYNMLSKNLPADVITHLCLADIHLYTSSTGLKQGGVRSLSYLLLG